MKTPRFELKDFRLNEILSMLTTYNGPSLSEELNRVWEALQKTLFPSRIKQNCSVRFFFTTSKNGVFFAIKIV